MLGLMGDRQRERLRAAVARQAAASGVTVRSFEEVALGELGVTDVAGQVLRAAVLGSAPAKTTSVDVFWFEGTFGAFMLAQPYQGGDPLVGEYHARLVGGLPQAVAFCRASFFRKKWATEDGALGHVLEGSPVLRGAVKQLAWARHGTYGKIELDWTVQLAALGDGTSHLVVQAGSSAWSADDTLLGAVCDLALALGALLGHEPREAQGRYFEPRYEDWFFA